MCTERRIGRRHPHVRWSEDKTRGEVKKILGTGGEIAIMGVSSRRGGGSTINLTKPKNSKDHLWVGWRYHR